MHQGHPSSSFAPARGVCNLASTPRLFHLWWCDGLAGQPDALMPVMVLLIGSVMPYLLGVLGIMDTASGVLLT